MGDWEWPGPVDVPSDRSLVWPKHTKGRCPTCSHDCNICPAILNTPKGNWPHAWQTWWKNCGRWKKRPGTRKSVCCKRSGEAGWDCLNRLKHWCCDWLGWPERLVLWLFGMAWNIGVDWLGWPETLVLTDWDSLKHWCCGWLGWPETLGWLEWPETLVLWWVLLGPPNLAS